MSRRVCKAAAINGVHDGSGILELDAGAYTVSTAGPTGVDEPDVDLVVLHLLGEELGVAGGVHDQKGGSKAGREGRGRFGDPHFSAGDFGGVTGDEMIHGLFFAEFGNRGEDAEGIAGEENNIGGVTGDAGDLGILMNSMG